MPVFGRHYRSGHAAVVHAVSTPYRERSHFDGQDVLESGFPGPGSTESGWLNRAISAIPSGGRIGTKGGIAVGYSTPLVLRGSAAVLGWAPQLLPVATDDTANRVLDLYARSDPILHLALAKGLETEKLASAMSDPKQQRGALNSIIGMRLAAEGAARLIAADDGPRIAALAFDGWDTHVNEGGATGHLAQLLSGLDAAFDAFESGLGPAWNDTAIVAITEFGRTARINGTSGTDHGTATVAMLDGGAIKGGRVIADWPGLKESNLYEGRDLSPTINLRAVLKGLLADQFGLSAAVLGDSIFPDSIAVKPMQGLLT
jgi:uncharacterized protein (DUF1501 family)